MIYAIGCFIAFFLALLILTKKGKNLADIILGIWMIVVGFHLLDYFAFVTNVIYEYPALLGFNIPMPFLHGPLLYLYTLALTNPPKLKNKKWLLHFVLPVFIIVIFTPLWIESQQQRIDMFKNDGEVLYTPVLIAEILMGLSGVFYVIITGVLLKHHKKRIADQFSNQEKISLNWLRFLFYAMCAMWVLIILVKNDTWIFTSSSVFVLLIGYFGIKQVGIFTNNISEINEVNTNDGYFLKTRDDNASITKKKYAKSGLNDDIATELHQRLITLMKTEKIFIEPELTLTDLAARLDIHPNYLSQVINVMEGVNFYDYINWLRIEEFKRLVAIPENQKFTLMALAYDCGFNSKSAFYRFFKKASGLPPSEYIRQLNS